MECLFVVDDSMKRQSEEEKRKRQERREERDNLYGKQETIICRLYWQSEEKKRQIEADLQAQEELEGDQEEGNRLKSDVDGSLRGRRRVCFYLQSQN